MITRVDRWMAGGLAALTIFVLLAAAMGAARAALLFVLLVFGLMFLMSLGIGFYLLVLALVERRAQRRGPRLGTVTMVTEVDTTDFKRQLRRVADEVGD